MGPTWGLQDPGGPHAGPMNLAIWAHLTQSLPLLLKSWLCKEPAHPQLWYFLFVLFVRDYSSFNSRNVYVNILCFVCCLINLFWCTFLDIYKTYSCPCQVRKRSANCSPRTWNSTLSSTLNVDCIDIEEEWLYTNPIKFSVYCMW